jgi:hypothetical protein
MNYFERYEKGERSLYKFNGELKKPNRWEETDWWEADITERFDGWVRRFLASLSVSQNLGGRGVGFINSLPTRGQSIGRIIRDEVFTWS